MKADARWTQGKSRLSILVAGAALLAVCTSIRFSWPDQHAQAQAPQPRVAASQPQSGAPVGTAAPAGPRQQPTVAAVVNGEKIGRDELARECLRRYGNDVLEALVNKQLILEECQRQGIVITKEQVDEEVKNIAQKFGMSPDRWLTMLKNERHISASHYANDIVWPTLTMRQLAADEIQVTQQELDRAFESEWGPQVEVRIISVNSREKAENLLAMAKQNPEDFDKLAKDYSEDRASASARGLIPPIRKHVGDPEIERVAFGLAKGEISPILHVANQFIILKCNRHIHAKLLAQEHRQEAQKQLIERIRDNKMRAAAGEIFKRLQDQAKIDFVWLDPQRRQQLPGVAAIVNGRRLTVQQLAEECLARNGVEVLEGEIHRKLLEQELNKQRLTVTQQDLDAEIARAAASYGYLKEDMTTPDVQRWLKDVTEHDGATVELYIRDAVWPSVALKKLVEGDIQVTQEDMQKGFEANFGERVEVLAIVLSNQRLAQKVWDMARNNPTDEFFGELARQYSVEAYSRANSGVVPPIHRHSGQPLIEKEAYALQPGEISGIISTQGRHIILKCLGRTKPVVKDFAAVKDELYQDIHEKKLRLAMGQKFDHIKETSQVDNFLTGASQLGKRDAKVQEKPASSSKRVTR